MDTSDIKKYFLREMESTTAGNFFYDFFNYKEEITTADITITFLERLRAYALDRVSPNSARTYLTYFKQALYKAIRMGVVFPIEYDDAVKYLKVRKVSSESIYLTLDELKLLEGYKPTTDPERFARAVFLLCSYTGCRVNDYPLITEANFVNGELHYTSHKTETTAKMPLHPLVPVLVEELKAYNYGSSAASMVAQYIKNIYHKLGMTEILTLFVGGKRKTHPKNRFISAHTARRSFATNLYLDGYDIKQISDMMGHASTQMTEGYIKTSYKDEISGDRTFFYPDKVARTKKERKPLEIESIKAQLKGLGLEDADIETIIRKTKLRNA